MKCKFAAEAAEVLARLKGGASNTNGRDEEEGKEVPFDEEMDAKKAEAEGVNTSMGAESVIEDKIERSEKARGEL